MTLDTIRYFAALAAVMSALGLQGCSPPSEAEMEASAKTLLASNDVKGAIIELKSAVQQYPRSGEARYLLGSALLSGGDPAGALIELQKARDLGADRDQLMPTLARAMLSNGQAKNVIDLFADTALKDRHATAELKTQVAWAYYRLGMADRWEPAVAAALQLDPKNEGARLQKALMLARDSRFDDALGLTNAVLADNPKQLDGWTLKGALLWGGKSDPDGASAAFRQALAIDPRFMPAQNALLTLLQQRGMLAAFRAQVGQLKKVLPNAFDTRFYDTQLALLDNDLARAREGAQWLLRTAPESALVLHLVGSVEVQTGALAQAKVHLSRAVQLRPDLPYIRRMLAVAELKLGDPDGALEALKPLVDSLKPGADIVELAAQASLQKGDFAAAEKYYAAAAKADPENSGVRVALALTQIAKGDSQTGLAALETLAAHDKGTSADYVLVNALISKGDIDAALGQLEVIQKKAPTDPAAYVIRGNVLRLRRDSAGARSSYEKALSVDANYLPAVAELAATDLSEGKPDDARKRYEAVLKRDPKNYRAMLALADLLHRRGAKVTEVEPLLLSAVQANSFDPKIRLALIQYRLTTFRAKQALTSAQEAVAAMPDDLALQDALGRAQYAAGDTQQAMATFRKIAASQSKVPDPYMRLADAYVGIKNYDAAVEALQSALKVAPNLVAAQRKLVEVELARKRVPAALEVARQVQKQRPREAVGYWMEASIHAGQKAWDPAIAAARSALEHERTTAGAARLYNLMLLAGRSADAERFAASWRRERPNDLDFVFSMATMALGRKDYAAAEALYRQVLAGRPDDAPTLNNVAWVVLVQGKPGAVPLAERAAQLAPGQPNVLDTLAQALLADKQPQKALPWARKAVELAPDKPAYRLTLAKLLVETGDREGARAELQTLAAMKGGFSQQAEVESLLAKL